MRKLAELLLGILLLASLAWAGSEPWKDKPYQQWDQKDIGQILGDSPWAKSVSVVAEWAPGGMGSAEQRGLPGVQQQGDQSGLGRTPGGPEGGRDMGNQMGSQNQAVAVFTARWISAQTVREALARISELDGKMNQAAVEQYLAQRPAEYQVVILGRDMSPFDGVSEADLTKDFEVAGKQGKVKLNASEAHVDRAAGGQRVMAVVFSFAKQVDGKPTFPPNEKDVEITCRLKKTTLRFHFDPRKMETKDGKDL